TLIKSCLIPKLHQIYEPSLLYIVFKELVPHSNKEFYEWYRINSNQYRLKTLLNTPQYKSYWDILFNPIHNRQELHNLIYDNPFISLDILHHIESSDLIVRTYINNNIKITIFDIEDRSNIDINHVFVIIKTMCDIFDISSDISINVYFIPSHQKKYL